MLSGGSFVSLWLLAFFGLCVICQLARLVVPSVLAGLAGSGRTRRPNPLSHPTCFAAAPPKYTLCVVRPLVAFKISCLVQEANRTLGIENGHTPAYELAGRLASRVRGSARSGIEDQNRILPYSGHICGFHAC